MLDTLFNLIKTELASGQMSDILGHVEAIVDSFSANFLKDGNTKDAAIDCIIQLLQAHKSTAPK